MIAWIFRSRNCCLILLMFLLPLLIVTDVRTVSLRLLCSVVSPLLVVCMSKFFNVSGPLEEASP